MQARSAILSLVASGKITAAEAERLLAVWNEGNEWMWIAFGCVVLCLTQIPMAGLGHLLHRLWEIEWSWLNRAVELAKEMGGRL